MALPPPPAGFVRMTNDALGGVEAPSYYSVESYRNTFYALGWRSVDDPGFIPTSTVQPSRFWHVPKNWGRHWFEAKAAASSRVVSVHCWGDSLTVGDDASGGATANTQAQKEAWIASSYVGLLADALIDKHGDAGSGFYPVGLAVTTGTWTSGIGFGGPLSTATAAASMTWTMVRGTSVKIFSRQGLTGSFRYQIDGGGFTTVTPPIGFGIEPGATVVTGLSDTTHTVRVEWVSGTVGIHGIAAFRGSAGVRVDRFAQHGQAGSDYGRLEYKRINATITNGAATFTIAGTGGFDQFDVGKYVVDTAGVSQVPSNVTIASVASATSATLSANASGTGTREFMLTRQPAERTSIAGAAVKPNTFNPDAAFGQADLVIIALGVNDPTSLLFTEQTFREGISSLLRPYSQFSGASDPTYTPDIAFVVHHQGTWFDVAGRWPSIAQSIYDMADSVQAAVFDAWEMGQRSWLHAKNEMLSPSSYWSGASGDNQIHPSVAGHQLLGGALIDMLV